MKVDDIKNLTDLFKYAEGKTEVSIRLGRKAFRAVMTQFKSLTGFYGIDTSDWTKFGKKYNGIKYEIELDKHKD